MSESNYETFIIKRYKNWSPLDKEAIKTALHEAFLNELF